MGGQQLLAHEPIHIGVPASSEQVPEAVEITENEISDPVAAFLERHGHELTQDHEGQLITYYEAMRCPAFVMLVQALGEGALSITAAIHEGDKETQEAEKVLVIEETIEEDIPDIEETVKDKQQVAESKLWPVTETKEDAGTKNPALYDQRKLSESPVPPELKDPSSLPQQPEAAAAKNIQISSAVNEEITRPAGRSMSDVKLPDLKTSAPTIRAQSPQGNRLAEAAHDNAGRVSEVSLPAEKMPALPLPEKVPRAPEYPDVVSADLRSSVAEYGGVETEPLPIPRKQSTALNTNLANSLSMTPNSEITDRPASLEISRDYENELPLDGDVVSQPQSDIGYLAKEIVEQPVDKMSAELPPPVFIRAGSEERQDLRIKEKFMPDNDAPSAQAITDDTPSAEPGWQEFYLPIAEEQSTDFQEYETRASVGEHDIGVVAEAEQTLQALKAKIVGTNDEEAQLTYRQVLDKIVFKSIRFTAGGEKTMAAGDNSVQDTEFRELFVRLFEELSIDSSPGTIEMLVKLASKIPRQELSSSKEAVRSKTVEPGTHEAIRQITLSWTSFKKKLAHAAKIGHSTLKLYSQKPAVS